MKIFIGGPLKIKTLKFDIIQKLDNIIKNKYEVLIGDADGVDRTVQEYFCSKKYQNVEVYCVNEYRNNLGNWKSVAIKVDSKRKNREYFTVKDKKMAELADVGFMIWNKKSEGTLSNILNLLVLKKNVCLFLYEENKLIWLKYLKDLETIILKENSNKLVNLYSKLLKRAKKNYIVDDFGGNKLFQLSLIN